MIAVTAGGAGRWRASTRRGIGPRVWSGVPRRQWRGAVARIDPKSDWATHLVGVPVPAVARDVGWRLAVVLRNDPDSAAIGFADGATGRIPFSEMRWARPWRPNGSFGPAPRNTADVVKPGDVVMVASAPAGSSQGELVNPKLPAAFTL